MSLGSTELERRLRGAYRAELERAPALRAEFKRKRRSQNSAVTRFMRRLFMPVFWACLFLNLVLKSQDAPLTAAVIALWAGGAAFRWGHQWFQQFYASEELVVLNFLPLDDRQIFRFQTRRYLGAVRWIAWELLLAYGVLGLVQGLDGLPLYALPAAALLQTLLVIALALHAASRLHFLPLNGLAGLLFTTAFALLIIGTNDLPTADLIIQASTWFLPTGWVNFVLLRVSTDPIVLALLLPVGAIIYLARFSWLRLRNFYSLEGFEILPSANRAAAAASDEEELSADSFNRRLGPTEIEDRISARGFLEGVNWESAGWLERFISRFLSPRERVVAEFLVAQNPGWTRGFRWSFWVWTVACVVVLLLGQLGGSVVVFFAAYVLAAAALPLFGGDWRGMRQAQTGGVLLPGFALYPIGFNTIARIFLKVNVVRIAIGLPLLLSFAAIAAWKLDQSPLTGLVLAAKLLGILLVLQPLFVLLPISNGTNDTSRMYAVWGLVVAPILLALVLCAVGVFISTNFAGLIASYALLLLLSLLLFVVYRRCYRKNRFDLFNQRHPQIG